MQDMEQLYQSYQRDVYRFLLSMSGDEELAEELTQETFCRAIDSVGRFRGECTVKSWLFQIARHLWYQALEKKKHHQWEPYSEDLDAGVDLAGAYLDREGTVDIYRRICALKEPMRQVVLLRVSGDLSFQEIGAILGRSENWARVTFYRAKQLLRKERDT